jgi:hypothetical protein
LQGTLYRLPRLAADLLVRGPLEVQIGVTHHRAPGGAWGQYAVIVAIVANAPANTKEATLPHHGGA